VAYVRTVKTASGATAVQIVHSSRRGSRDIEHVGSAHDDAQLELLKAAARQRLAAGQGDLDLGLESAGQARGKAGGPLPITASRMGHLWDALSHAYEALGFDVAAGGDEVFRCLVLARIIEPTSKLDSLRVLDEVGIRPPSYPTMNRRLPVFAKESWRERLAALCAHHVGLGPATYVLYDVTTLYFETDTGDGFRESGFSKERRLEPQITVGLLTDAAGFPLMVNAFEGNKAETTTMLPVIKAFMAAHRLRDVVIVADAGMISESNMTDIEAAGLSFILGMKIPDVPYVVDEWCRKHPDEAIPDGHVFVQPWPAGTKDKRKDQVRYYQYKHDRARRTLKGIDEQRASHGARLPACQLVPDLPDVRDHGGVPPAASCPAAADPADHHRRRGERPGPRRRDEPAGRRQPRQDHHRTRRRRPGREGANSKCIVTRSPKLRPGGTS